MLRTVTTEHVRSRMMGFTFDATASAGTTLVGSSWPEGTASRQGTGDVIVSFTKPFARNCVAVGGVVGASLNGGFFGHASNPGATAFRANMHRNTDGVLAAASGACIVLGHDSPDLDTFGLQRLMADRDWSRLITVQVNTAAPGTISLGSGDFATITRNGTGDVTLTFSRAFQSQSTPLSVNYPVVPVATAITATPNVMVSAKVISVSSVQFTAFGPTGTATDAQFNAFILGWDTIDPSLNNRGEVRNSQLRARLIAGRIALSGGTPTVSVGTGDFTVSSGGTGIIAVTFTRKFVRAPVVIGCGEEAATLNGRVTVSSPTASTVNLHTGDATGGAVDFSGAAHFFALGFDDPTDS